MMRRGFKPKGSFRKPGPTKIGKRIALMQCILNRESFTESDIESLARGFGHPIEDVRDMVTAELAKREARRVV
jgi:hypothetical protein